MALLLYAVAVLAVAIFTGVRHDYGSYIIQWELSNSGGDPWSDSLVSKNAYGPAHVLIGYFATIHPLLPKLLMALTNVGVLYIILQAYRQAKQNIPMRDSLLIACAYFVFPLVTITSLVYGINDSVVAWLLALAYVARAKTAFVLSGVLIGVAALLKFYPILFLPFFMLDAKRGMYVRGLVAGLATLVVGMVLSYLAWGDSVLAPLLFGSEREAKMLSILRFLNPVFTHLGMPKAYSLLVDLNTYMLLAATAFWVVHAWFARLDWRLAVLVGSLLVFTIYKVGHFQFYLPWSALLIIVLAESARDEFKQFAKEFFPVLVFLSLYVFIYLLSGVLGGDNLKGSFYFVRVAGSVPFLFIVLFCLYRVRCQLLKKWHLPALRF